MSNERDHHEELKALVAAHGITQARAAEILSEAVGDEISARTVRKWMNARGLSSSRKCPGWVIYVLRRELG